MYGKIQKQSISDIKGTVQGKKEIISSTVAAHALSGRDSVSSYHRVGKLCVMKRLRDGKKLLHLECLKTNLEQVMLETICLISNCYGYSEV